MASSLINATVRMRGACYSRPNSRRQIRAPWLAISGESDIEVLESPRARPLSVAITNLLRYNPTGKFGDRVKRCGASWRTCNNRSGPFISLTETKACA